MKTRQRGHSDYSFLAIIFGGVAVGVGIGLIVAGAWLVWYGAGVLGWR